MTLDRRTLLLSGAAVAAAVAVGAATLITTPSPAAATPIKVYKDPSCGCCSAWVDHLTAAGFKAEVDEGQDMAQLKRQLGVPDDLASCHTAVVGDYAIEGHVPADDIKRLLKSRPKGKGLAVPGMPINSPGMEVPGEPNERYTVWLFQANGQRTAFATHGG